VTTLVIITRRWRISQQVVLNRSLMAVSGGSWQLLMQRLILAARGRPRPAPGAAHGNPGC
jgi:hypothetical protein